jgi:hypothetical protein
MMRRKMDTPEGRVPRYQFAGAVTTTGSRRGFVNVHLFDLARPKRDGNRRLKRIENASAEELRGFEIIGALDAGVRWTGAVTVLAPIDSGGYEVRQIKARKDWLHGPNNDYRNLRESMEAKAHIKHMITTIPAGTKTTEDKEYKDFVAAKINVMEPLNMFYSSSKLTGQLSKTRAEVQRRLDLFVEAVIRALGLCSGRKEEDKAKKCAFVIGDADFGVHGFGSASMHGRFTNLLTRKLQSIGVTVYITDEYYTSQLCPICTGYLDRVNMRVNQCEDCDHRYHRDLAASMVMARNALRLCQGGSKFKRCQR